MKEVITRVHVLNASGGIIKDAAHLEKLIQETVATEQFKGKPEPVVLEAIMQSVRRQRTVQTLMRDPEIPVIANDPSAVFDRKVPKADSEKQAAAMAKKPNRLELSAEHVAATKFQTPLEQEVKSHAPKAVLPKSSREVIDGFKKLPGYSEPVAKSGAWKELQMGDKITIGTCLLFGASFLLSGASRAQSAFSKDEEGKRHVNATSMTIALAEMAAGTAAAIFAHSLYRGASR